MRTMEIFGRDRMLTGTVARNTGLGLFGQAEPWVWRVPPPHENNRLSRPDRKALNVTTMNGNPSAAFQFLGRLRRALPYAEQNQSPA